MRSFAAARAYLSAGLALLLAACATVPEPVSEPQRVWAERQTQLAGLSNWSAYGRLGIQSQEEGWNVAVHWTQRGDAYRIRFNAPLGQGSMELAGGPNGVSLTTAKNEVITAGDPETLLFDAVGWRVPLGGLRYWLLGRTEAGAPVDGLDLDPAGRLQLLQQSGWRVQYLRYGRVGSLELPTKVFLENPRLSARLVVSRWDLKV